jgi:hypothetical protein
VEFLNSLGVYYKQMGELILIITSIALLSMIATALRYGIGPVPTSPKVKRALLPLLPPLSKGPIYELGAGFGTLAFALADHYPDCEVIAVEVSPIPYFWMTVRKQLRPRLHLKIRRKDFFKLPLNDAALIVCYLYPGAMLRLEEKLAMECPQAPILTHTFALPSRKADVTRHAEDLYCTPIYFYTVSKKITASQYTSPS